MKKKNQGKWNEKGCNETFLLEYPVATYKSIQQIKLDHAKSQGVRIPGGEHMTTLF